MIACSARFLAVVVLVLCASFAVPTRAQDESLDPLSIKVAEVTVPAGGSGEAVVTIVLASGFSILAAPTPTQWTTAGSLAVTSSGGIVAKTPVFPTPGKERDADGGIEIHTWSGKFEVRVPIEVAPKTATGAKILHGRLRYQIYSEGSFYKVATREIEIPVKVVKAKKGSGSAAAPATRP